MTGKSLTKDKLKCLPSIVNCMVYEDSTVESVELLCKQCIDQWMYLKESLKCAEGEIAKCQVYNLDQTCQ